MALSTNDVQFIVAEKGSRFAWSYAPTLEAAQAIADEQTNLQGKSFEVEPYDDFQARVNQYYRDEFKLAEVTEAFHDEMLNCLPPMHRAGAMGFFMCEMTTGSLTSQFVAYRGKYYGACVDVLDRETWITPEKIEALEAAPALEWFPKREESQ